MIKVYNAENLNRNDVIALWMKCFGDSREYVEFFLDNCPGYVCVEYFVEDKLVSQLFLLEGELASEKCKYLYAACTHEDYRRRGIMEELIEFTKTYCKDKNYSSIFLVPANERLYSFYSKFGFVASFIKKELNVHIESESLSELTEADVDEVFDIKKELVENINGFRFTDDVMKYTIKEHLFNNGKIYFNKNVNEKAVVFYYIIGPDIVVKELLTEKAELGSQIFQHFFNKDVENIYIFSPIVYNSTDIMEKYTKCGMCFPLNNRLSDFLKKHTDLYAGMYLD